MSDLVVGLSTGCFFQTSIFDCLEMIRRAGFEIIEVCSFSKHLDYHDLNAVQRARRLMDKLGIEPYSFHAPYSEAIDVTAISQSVRHQAMAELLYATEAAAILGVRYMVLHPGPERSNLPAVQRQQRIQNAIGVLRDIAETCNRCKMTLLLENMLPHLFLGNIHDLTRIVDALSQSGVGICLDTGHAYLSGNLLSITRQVSSRLEMVHVHDNRGIYDDHLSPGDGKIPWTEWWSQVSTGSFHAAIILEIAGHSDSNAVLNDANRGMAYLKHIIYAHPPKVDNPSV